VHLVVFYYKNTSRCTVLWKSNCLSFEYVTIIGLYTNSNRQIFPPKTQRAYRCRLNWPKQPNPRTTYNHNISFLMLLRTWDLNTLLDKMLKFFSFLYRQFDRKMTQDRNFLVLFLVFCTAGYVNFYTEKHHRFKCKRFS
jgi:hypothetical protein